MWLPWLCAGCARVFYLQRQGSAFCPWAVGGERGDHSGGVDRGGMPPAAHSLRGSNKFGKARHRWSNSSAICMHSVSHRPRRTCSWSPPPRVRTVVLFDGLRIPSAVGRPSPGSVVIYRSPDRNFWWHRGIQRSAYGRGRAPVKEISDSCY
jgi:hypothetical protein